MSEDARRQLEAARHHAAQSLAALTALRDAVQQDAQLVGRVEAAQLDLAAAGRRMDRLVALLPA